MYARKGKIKITGRTKAKKMCKSGDYRILYWFGMGLELLSACLVAEVCQASKVFLMRKESLSMTLELSKSLRWLNDHTCFAMFDLLALVFFLIIILATKPLNGNAIIHRRKNDGGCTCYHNALRAYHSL